MDISRQSMAKIEDLMAMDIESYRLLILSKIENRSLLAEFVNSLESDTKIWDYAVAAGLLTRDEVKWIKEKEAEGGDDEGQSPKVYVVSGSGIDSTNSDLKTANEIYEFISANYEIIPDERTDTQYKCSLKSGGTPIQFYLNEQECETNNLSLDMSSGTTMETARINFNTTTSAEYGVKVAMNDSIRIYDDRED